MVRRRPKFSAVKLIVEIISTLVTIWLAFSIKIFKSLTTGEQVSLFGYILSLFESIAL